MSSAVVAQPPGQPQLKAPPVAQLIVTADLEAQSSTKPIGSSLLSSIGSEKNVSSRGETTSELDTIALIRRVLLPDSTTSSDVSPSTTSLERDLPSLTSSNTVDLQLYAILSIVVRDLVNTWYTQITTDHGFVEEVIQIVAHCSRAIEQRLRRTDIAVLLLDEVTVLLVEHIQVYRLARRTSEHSPFGVSLRQVYHELCQHPALNPVPQQHPAEQLENETTYRQLLVRGALAVLLPIEDLQNDPLRLLVGDIIADVIIGQALAGKICEDWFLYNSVYKVATILSDNMRSRVPGGETRSEERNRLEKFGLLSASSDDQQTYSSHTNQSAVVIWLWTILQYGYLLWLFVRRFLKEVQHARIAAPRRTGTSKFDTSPTPSMRGARDPSPLPVLAFSVYNAMSTLLNLADRMPWLVSFCNFWQHILIHGFGQIGAANSIFDRLLYNTVQRHILSQPLVPHILLQLRLAVFPDDRVGPPAPPPPSAEERIRIKRRTAASIRDLIPDVVAHKYYGTANEEDIITDIERDMLDPFSDAYLNKHLIYSILELVFVRLIPELAQQEISELLSERGVTSENTSVEYLAEMSSPVLDKKS